MGKLDAASTMEKYWGVLLRSFQFDPLSMMLRMNLIWTSEGESRYATLTFNGVCRFELNAEHIFQSEVVELVSVESKFEHGRFEVKGELSNYNFSIVCNEINDSEEQ